MKVSRTLLAREGLIVSNMADCPWQTLSGKEPRLVIPITRINAVQDFLSSKYMKIHEKSQ